MNILILCLDILFWICIAICIVARIDQFGDLRGRYHQTQIYRRQCRELGRFPNAKEMTPYAVIIFFEETVQFVLASVGLFSTQSLLFIPIVASAFIPTRHRWWYFTRIIMCVILLSLALINRVLKIIELPELL